MLQKADWSLVACVHQAGDIANRASSVVFPACSAPLSSVGEISRLLILASESGCCFGLEGEERRGEEEERRGEEEERRGDRKSVV